MTLYNHLSSGIEVNNQSITVCCLVTSNFLTMLLAKRFSPYITVIAELFLLVVTNSSHCHGNHP